MTAPLPPPGMEAPGTLAENAVPPRRLLPMPPPALPDMAPRTWLQWLWEEERIGIPLCLGVATFITLAFGGGFWVNLLYSFCIGQTIQFTIEAGRHGASRWQQQRRGLQKVPQRPWPGWGFMAPWLLASSVFGYWFGMHLGDWITGRQNIAVMQRQNLGVWLPIVLVTLTSSVGATWFFYARGRMAWTEAQLQSAQRAAAENQLRLLQSQLEPHMLFNTLANLRVLIALDPPRAQAMLDQLVNFLRSTLQASRQDAHPLKDEFARVADYLALMQVRMGARLQVALDLPDELAALPVPPLLLQPLVENAIKHGLEPQREGGRLALAARRDNTHLVLTVRDTGAGLPPDDAVVADSTRFGLEQVRARLAATYGSAATLTLQTAPDAEGGTLATLTLPVPAAPAQ